jgi:hypothetical protein
MAQRYCETACAKAQNPFVWDGFGSHRRRPIRAGSCGTDRQVEVASKPAPGEALSFSRLVALDVELAEHHDHDEADDRGHDADKPLPEPCRDADGAGQPHAGSRRQALHLATPPDDGAGGQKGDAGRDRLDDADRISLRIVAGREDARRDFDG